MQPCHKTHHTSQEAVKKVDSSVRDASTSRGVESRPEAKSRGEPIQRADEGHDLPLGNMEYFEMCEITLKSAVPPLYDILDERHCVLYLRNMLATFGQNSQSQQGSVRCSVDSKLRDKERCISRCTSHVSANKARKNDYTFMLDRFRNCSRYRESQIKIGWYEEHNTVRLQSKTTPTSLQRNGAKT